MSECGNQNGYRYSRHVVLQIVGSALVVLAAHWFLPFAKPEHDAADYLFLARNIRFEGASLYSHNPELQYQVMLAHQYPGTIRHLPPGIPDAALHFPPGYPWILSFFVGQDNLGRAPLVQRMCLGVTIGLSSIWTTIKFGSTSGWLVFVLLSINPALIASSGRLSSEALHLPFYLAGFLAWFGFLETRNRRMLMVCAVCFGLSIYLRAYGLLLVLFLPVLLTLGRNKFSWKEKVGYGTVFAACCIFILAPWVARNYWQFGHVIPITTSGKSLYAGWFPPGPKQFGMTPNDEVVKAAAKIEDLYARDVFYREATIRRLLEEPQRAAVTIIRKYVFYLMPLDWEYFGWINRQGRLRPSLHFIYVFLLPFVIGYTIQHRKDTLFWTRDMAPVFYGFLMTLLVYGIPRFRLCIEPFLTIFAASYLVGWIKTDRSFRTMLAATYFLACIAAACVVRYASH